MNINTVLPVPSAVNRVSVSTARRRAAAYGLKVRKDKEGPGLYGLFQIVRVYDRRKYTITHKWRGISGHKTPTQIVELIEHFDRAASGRA
jgi:hypothetical protein